MKSTEGKRDRNVKTFTHVNLNVEQVEVVDVIDRHTIGQMSLEEHSQLMTISFGSSDKNHGTWSSPCGIDAIAGAASRHLRTPCHRGTEHG